MYRLIVQQTVVKDLRRVPKADVQKITAKIQALAREPRPNTAKKLQGSRDLYRLRQGDYRIIYQIQDKVVTVIVIKVGHRRDVYG